MELTLFKFTSKSGNQGYRGTYNGLPILVMVDTIPANESIVASLSADKTVYFGNLASTGIKVKVSE